MTNPSTDYFRKSPTGRVLRAQILSVPAGGWVLSHAEEVGKGPADLRGYPGGWELTPRVYTRYKLAERAMHDHGYAPVDVTQA